MELDTLVSLLLLTTYVMTWDRDGGMLGYDGIVLKVGGLWDIYRMLLWDSAICHSLPVQY